MVRIINADEIYVHLQSDLVYVEGVRSIPYAKSSAQIVQGNKRNIFSHQIDADSLLSAIIS